ncbi:hypothetical protein GXW78_20670 [Roseomonas terrae]|uniref:Uncharacterized protein n=1 Tax=Neoroseomonas terrae TaxID=424799 RepID=A0ABS5EM26_9PROT|nr:hypothetical protein [Neoroseomonas terrae]MBR0652083.1 hypothetical protein [Neoroseomonas terrae]
MRTAGLLAFVLILAAGAAWANPAEDAARHFIGARGFAVREVAPLQARRDAALAPSAEVSPGGGIGPLETALLLTDALEPALPRTRTLVSLGQVQVPDGASELTLSLVEVRRFNLGPALHASAVAGHGAANVAPAAEFGVGPHLAWRFVFMPMMGQASVLADAARRTIPPDEARTARCLGLPCLDPAQGPEGLQAWQETGESPPPWTAAYPPRRAGRTVGAQLAAELGLAMGIATVEGGRAAWQGPETPEGGRPGEPFLFLLIDRDLGQEQAIDAVIGQTRVMDHDIRETWQRRLETPEAVYRFGATIRR